MGRPAKLSRERLQEAALALVDAHGLAGLSMRALASAVGTAPMTLYNHVSDRADLEVLVVDAVLAGAAWSREPHDDWRDERARDRDRALARGARAPARDPARSRRGAAARRRCSSPRRRCSTRSHAVAARASPLLVAFRTVIGFVLGFAQAELAGPLAAAAGEPAATVIARFRALPRFRYPRLVEIAGAAATSDAEREFRAALELVVAGLG